MHGTPPQEVQYIKEAANQGVNIPATDDGRNFSLSFYLKGVCIIYCGGRNSHRALSQSEFGWLVRWHEKFCSNESDLPVREVDAGGISQASTLSARTSSPRGSSGGRSIKGGGTPPPPPNISKEKTPDIKGALE